jgi:hypothetical protein
VRPPGACTPNRRGLRKRGEHVATLPESQIERTASEVSDQVREIEVKYRLHDLAALERELGKRGIALSPPVRQDDQAYAQQGWAYGQTKIGVAFARLRTQDGRHLFTVKMPLDNEMACIEYETVVADRAQMHGAVMAMGFVPPVRIVKTRRTATWTAPGSLEAVTSGKVGAHGIEEAAS